MPFHILRALRGHKSRSVSYVDKEGIYLAIRLSGEKLPPKSPLARSSSDWLRYAMELAEMVVHGTTGRARIFTIDISGGVVDAPP